MAARAGDEPDPFDQEELAAIVVAAEDLSPAFGLMTRAWAQSGMRSGELRGLRRGDLDPVRGQVKVEHGRLGPAKTLRSRRTASLLYPVVEPTADWGPTTESWWVLGRLARVVPLNPDVPLFGSIATPGHPMQEPELWRWWSRVLARTKVRTRTPENLRAHVRFDPTLAGGTAPAGIAAQAGHTPAVMLAHYSKWLPGACRVKPDEPWTGRCGKEKIAADGKRHRCPQNGEAHRRRACLSVQSGVEAVLGGYPPCACRRPRDKLPRRARILGL